jgi:hypothetical protein
VNHSHTVSFRASTRVLAALESRSTSESRTRSMQVLHYVLQGLIRDGFEMSQLDPRNASHE